MHRASLVWNDRKNGRGRAHKMRRSKEQKPSGTQTGCPARYRTHTTDLFASHFRNSPPPPNDDSAGEHHDKTRILVRRRSSSEPKGRGSFAAFLPHLLPLPTLPLQSCEIVLRFASQSIRRRLDSGLSCRSTNTKTDQPYSIFWDISSLDLED